MRFSGASALAAATAALIFSGCGAEPAETPVPQAVEIPFRAVVGAEPFACGRSYAGLGTTGATWEAKDFRMYVHDVRLVASDGTEVPVTLTEDGTWQGQGVTLLDFEDKRGECINGTEGTNTRVVGTVPAGTYKGLRFVFGVPFERNHQDASVAEAPLNVSALFWSWQGGYKFLRLDGRTAALPGLLLHVGSTGCEMSGPNQVSSCSAPNRVELSFDGFEPGRSEVVLDVKALFAGSNLDENTQDTPVGCMSGETDPECGPTFERLGLPFGGKPANPAGQTFVRVE